VSFGRLASSFLEAKNNPSTLQVFINTFLGRTWKQGVISKGEDEILKARVDLSPQTVPADAVVLTCGIDHQKYGFWFVVRAWTRDMTSWLIHYGFLPTWADVEKLLYEMEYPDEDGRKHRIWRVAIDTGGGEKDEGLSMTEKNLLVDRPECRAGSRPVGNQGILTPHSREVPAGRRASEDTFREAPPPLVPDHPC